LPEGQIKRATPLARAAVVFRGTQVTAGWSWADIKTNIVQRRRAWPAGPG